MATGDEAWHRLLDRHDGISWDVAARHGGTIVKSTGDGVLVRFDATIDRDRLCRRSPGHAAVEGLRIRCGLHTGEIGSPDNGDITGFAVNLAARIEQACDEGAILVSSTVRDLLQGGAARFEDRGEHQLKGFDSPWHLYSLVGSS